MTLKELYEQTDYSKINQLKVYENGEKPKFIEVTVGMASLRPYYDYLVIGLEPYIHYYSFCYEPNTNDQSIPLHAKLRVVISKNEEE